MKIKGYDDAYCPPKSFQPTFNEYGRCYTFNNHQQGMDKHFEGVDYQNKILNHTSYMCEENKTIIDKEGNANTNDPPRDILKVRINIKISSQF